MHKNLSNQSKLKQIDDPGLLGKINKQMSPRLRLINNQNKSETKTRPRVPVPCVLKP
jgi:hypothetical protein